MVVFYCADQLWCVADNSWRTREFAEGELIKLITGCNESYWIVPGTITE